MAGRILIIAALMALVVSGCGLSHQARHSRTIDDLYPSGEGKTYDVPYDVAYQIAIDTLEQRGLSIKKDDPNNGDIRAFRHRHHWGVYGESCSGTLFGIFLTKIGTSQTRVEIKSLTYMDDDVSLGCTIIAEEITLHVTQRLTVYPELLQSRFKNLADQMSSGINAHRVSHLAVLPIADATLKTRTPLSDYLAEKVTTELSKTTSAKVLERSQFQRVLEELKLTKGDGFDDPSVVKKIGGRLGIDAIVTGTYAVLITNMVEVQTRIVTIRTAEDVTGGTVYIPRSYVLCGKPGSVAAHPIQRPIQGSPVCHREDAVKPISVPPVAMPFIVPQVAAPQLQEIGGFGADKPR